VGGSGSTRWIGHAKKCTVEECARLNANRLMREGILLEGIHQSGVWSWLDSITGETTSSLGYEVDTTNPAHSWIRLFYTITSTGDKVDYTVRLTSTRPYFGGLRWWFICPLPVNGRICYRRVGKLYLPYYARFYGCRHCYDLTYRSSQEADKRVYWLRRNPEALMEIVRDRDSADASKLFLALKALNGWLA
jgi:hypothetical protein